MAFIAVVSPDKAEGDLKEIYDRIGSARGSIAHVHQIASLHPELMQGHLDFYMTLMFGKGGLKRRERELIATAVSRLNGCEYCTVHHGEAFARYEKEASLVTDLMASPEKAGLNDRDRALVTYATKLTRTPNAVESADVDAVRKQGFDDKDVLAAAAITGYFNFVNRLVLGLGVDLEHAEVREYKV